MTETLVLTAEESRLKQLLLDVCLYIGKQRNAKPELRFTGGWVRDKLLGTTSVDIDIGIDNMTGLQFGTQMKQYLASPESKYEKGILGNMAKIEANPEKSKHLETVTTKILGFDVDLVNLRKETYLENSRTPLMDFGSPTEDASRRDATVNALFYNLSSSEVEDLTGRGLNDMQSKLIKTPLSPLQTFQDDPLRVLRAIRFASRLDFHIATEDQSAMGNPSIKDALIRKISRERVGVEVTKMLKGPNPHSALSMIDCLGLYNTVFTNPKDEQCNVVVSSARWSRAYDQLLKFVSVDLTRIKEPSSLLSISSILLCNPESVFLAWMVVCFVPWAREPLTNPVKSNSKKLPSKASMAAQEGLKADRKIIKLVDDAASHLQKIIMIKDTVKNGVQLTSSPLKRKRQAVDRVSQGWAIRRWGPNWRISVMYALLTQVGECASDDDAQLILDDYAAWLLDLRSLDLLDIYNLKHIVRGDKLTEALGVESGPWMKKAMDTIMDWQLRNPDSTDTSAAIAAVLDRRNELGIT